MRKTKKESRRATRSPKRKPVAPKRPPVVAKPAQVATVEAKVVDASVAYLEVAIREPVTESSVESLFERAREQIVRSRVKRVLVDLREGSVDLTISDLHGLAKMVATAFAGVLERFALVLRPQDVLAEKFFEPSVNNRGLPTFVTTDPDEAAYWISAKIRPVR
jgi:hypothetical protein